MRLNPMSMDLSAARQAVQMLVYQCNARDDEIERLTLWKQDIEAQTALIMDEECGTDERHCTCVPILRREVDRLRAELAVEKHENGRWEHICDELETRLVECQRLLRFVRDHATRNAGNVSSPFTYVWQRDWDEFEEAAQAAGGDDE